MEKLCQAKREVYKMAKSRTFHLRSGEIELVGEIYTPEKSGPHPSICICHGIPATPYSPDSKGYAYLAKRFCLEDFTTLIFNFRGTGKSQGNFDLLGWSYDLQIILDFLFGLDEVDKSHIHLLGFSGGAAVSVYVASQDPRVTSLTACACPAEFSTLANKENLQSTIRHFHEIGAIKDKDFPHSAKKWLEGFETISPIKWIDKLSPRQLLLIHGDADEVVPLEHARRLYQKARQPKDLAIIPGAGHKLRLNMAAMETALKWIKNQQKGFI
jgi:uncharacterized protein